MRRTTGFLTGVMMATLSLAFVPSVEAEVCAPSPSGPLALVCAEAEVVGWQVDSSTCSSVAVYCAYGRILGRHSADGGVFGVSTLTIGGFAAGGDSCSDLSYCTTLVNGYFDVGSGRPDCVKGTATSTNTALGLTISDAGVASC